MCIEGDTLGKIMCEGSAESVTALCITYQGQIKYLDVWLWWVGGWGRQKIFVLIHKELMCEILQSILQELFIASQVLMFLKNTTGFLLFSFKVLLSQAHGSGNQLCLEVWYFCHLHKHHWRGLDGGCSLMRTWPHAYLLENLEGNLAPSE